MAQILNYVRYVLRFLLFFISNLYALPCYATWMFLFMPLRLLAPKMYWKVESFMFGLIQGMIVTWLHGYQVLECGDDISLLRDREALMLCNHQSTGDTPLVMLANYTKGSAVGNTMWIMWYIFKYTNFGLVSLIRQDFFIHSGKDIRLSEMDRLKRHMKTAYLEHGRKWVIVFPEGGFLRKRLEASQKFARKNNLPVLQHVTLPRLGAVESVLSTVGEPYVPSAESFPMGEEYERSNGHHYQLEPDPKRPLKWVIDVTLAYKDGKPLDMLGMCIGYCPNNLITFHYKAYRVRDIPRDIPGLTDWLYKRYVEKDKILEDFYKTGRISREVLAERRMLRPLEPTYLQFDLLQNILSHAFCIGSCYLHYIFIYYPLLSIISSLFGSIF
ncbi:acyl-CoA:lysophosphatidylglycerol acyltransferase 1 [Plakobranchus ocellatus]|uniref:Acyl-CoA:lysophosphatidylglycerol acyltransferase 1 n=1 Tax=Plakobranchus ocellatus TaxID=259542 RepID=A0AAV3ZP45_9GAST|nr:acyl-CoA:lysophosphatidylglycerol acyltransferase 1 [Plakobranchus ocellatus]